MADEQQLSVIKQGAEAWNDWLRENPGVTIDLSYADLPNLKLAFAYLGGANLYGADLSGADLSDVSLINANLQEAQLLRANLNRADLREANLEKAVLYEASLIAADLEKARLHDANLNGADLSGANLFLANLGCAQLVGANLSQTFFMGAGLHMTNLRRSNLTNANLVKTAIWGANLEEANLSGADLCEADLTGAKLIDTNLTGANLDDCRVYGIAAWNLKLQDAQQTNLIITKLGEPDVTVDNLEVAQFIYMLLNNAKIRDVIDTVAKKGILILGRFSPERKAVLDAIREKLRQLNFVPIMFDFEGARTKDFTETVKILAGMCRFIIADITMPKSSPLELGAIVPDFMIPFVPIIREGEEPFSMFSNLQNKYDWVLDVLEYKDAEQLVAVLEKAVVEPAIRKESELLPRKVEEVRKRRAEDYF